MEMRRGREKQNIRAGDSAFLFLLVFLIPFALPACGSRNDYRTSLDTTFGSGGKVLTSMDSGNAQGKSLAIQPDGKILLAGDFIGDDQSQFMLVRYNTDGSLDTAFGNGGKVTTTVYLDQDSANAVVLQPDGKIILAGFSWNDSDQDFGLVRYNSDGSLDGSFGSGGKVITSIIPGNDEKAYAAAIQPDGKIILAGYSGGEANSVFALVRYNADGSLDGSFGSGGKVTTPIGSVLDIAYAVAVQGNGKIVLAGFSFNEFDSSSFALAGYNANGSLDTSFGSGGKVTTAVGTADSIAYSLAISSGGKIIAGGYANNGGSDLFALACYDTGGNLDPSFGSGGIATTDFGAGGATAFAAALQSDGKILLAGYSEDYEDNDEDGVVVKSRSFAAARYMPDGTPDFSFGSEGKLTIDLVDGLNTCYAVAVSQDGRIVLGGYSQGDSDNFSLVRLTR